MDVIAAFDKPNCDNTVFDTFPACPSAGTTYIGWDTAGAILSADDVSSFSCLQKNDSQLLTRDY